MKADGASMRWSPGRIQSWRRPEDGGFDPARYGVEALDEATAREYVLARHYSGTWPATRLRYGLFDLDTPSGQDPLLVGAAVLSVPTSPKVLTNVFPGLAPYDESLELGRFVLDDLVPANAESWFLAQALRQAAEGGLRGVVSFSDPVPRTSHDGKITMPGHWGTIYQASNAAYLGRATRRTLALMRDGSVLSARAMQKIRAQERGHEYAEQFLVDFGARPMRPGEKPAAWLTQALNDAGARKLRHKGNHRYGFTAGTKSQRRAVVMTGERCAYPKQRDEMELAA